MVFVPLMDSENPGRFKLGEYVFEYICSLGEHQQRVQSFLSEFLGQLYLDSGRCGELIMIVQHALLEESIGLGRILIKDAPTNSLRFQLGIDILKRLKEDEEVIHQYLDRKLVFIHRLIL